MKTYREAQSRFGGCMQERDFGELHALLSCFYSTYAVHEEEVKLVLDTVAATYSTEYGLNDPSAIKELRNPRGAGRKKKRGDKEKERVIELHRAGYTVRKIASETGIPKSTVQRMLDWRASRY